MRSLLFAALTAAASTALSSGAFAQTTVDTFTGGVNLGGWAFINGFDVLEAAGGNPGEYLHNDFYDTFAPMPRTTGSSAFTGDWRANDVTSFGLDLRTFATQFQFQREASLVLTSGNCSVYWLGTQLVPQVNEGWKSFDFAIDAQSATLPAGWTVLNGCGSDDATWNTVMTNVTEVMLFYGDPTNFFIFDVWDVGLDNARITYGSGLGASYCGPAVPNSTGSSAELLAAGSAVAASNDVTLTARALPQNSFGYFLTSRTQGLVTNPGGSQGNLCLGGAIGRYVGPGQIQNSGAQGMFALTLDLTQTPTPSGFVSVVAGETWNYQAWFRDSVGGVATSNFTDGLELQFQ
jgi:hypothetical protein